jgi:type VI secretion system secreted protein Hcp
MFDMPADYFLKLTGIKGESTDSKHKDQIEIESFSWGATNQGSFAQSPGAGGGAGKVNFQDLHFTKLVDKSSPLLGQACATGEHIKEAELSVRKQGGTQQDYYKIKLTDVLISSYQSGGSNGSSVVPTDQFSINFAKIEYSLQPQDAKGNVGAPTKMGWDLKANKKL